MFMVKAVIKNRFFLYIWIKYFDTHSIKLIIKPNFRLAHRQIFSTLLLMANARKVPGSTKKSGESSSSDSAANNSSSKSNRQRFNSEESRSSPLFILGVGFVFLIAYTIWTSLQTYGNIQHSDME